MESQNEVKNFIKVWTTILISLSFCHAIAKKVPIGTKRLIFTLPIATFFLFLPLKLRSISFGLTTSFLITWLCNFKLLLFSFGKGPLAVPQINTTFHFVAVACLPIEIQQNPSHKKCKNKWGSLKLLIKLCLLAGLCYLYHKKWSFSHPKFDMILLHSPLVYLLAETIMVGLAAAARAVLRVDLEPQFDEPYLSTSLEDFWFRRYNLPVSHLMRTTIQDPIFSLWAKLVGPRWAYIPAVMGSFTVNGLVHKIVYFYVGRTWPSWDITWYFILHGSILTAEIYVKKSLTSVDTWRVPRVLSVALTNGFIGLTTAWLFLPPLLRLGHGDRLFGEYQAFCLFFKTLTSYI